MKVKRTFCYVCTWFLVSCHTENAALVNSDSVYGQVPNNYDACASSLYKPCNELNTTRCAVIEKKNQLPISSWLFSYCTSSLSWNVLFLIYQHSHSFIWATHHTFYPFTATFHAVKHLQEKLSVPHHRLFFFFSFKRLNKIKTQLVMLLRKVKKRPDDIFVAENCYRKFFTPFIY